MKVILRSTLVLILLMIHIGASAQQRGSGNKIQVNGIFPDLALVAGHSPRTEAGIGAMVPGANRLWLVTYVAHMKKTGSGTGRDDVVIMEMTICITPDYASSRIPYKLRRAKQRPAYVKHFGRGAANRKEN